MVAAVLTLAAGAHAQAPELPPEPPAPPAPVEPEPSAPEPPAPEEPQPPTSEAPPEESAPADPSPEDAPATSPSEDLAGQETPPPGAGAAGGPPVRSFEPVDSVAPAAVVAAQPAPAQPAPTQTAPSAAEAKPADHGGPAVEEYPTPPPKKKYGDGKLFYSSLEVGFLATSLQNFTGSEFNIDATEAAGLVMGADFGLRLAAFTIGPHFRFAPMNNFDYLSFGGDLGFRIPIERVDLSFRIGGGFASTPGVPIAMIDREAVELAMADPTPENIAAAAPTVEKVNGTGGNILGSVGLDFFVLENLTVGARIQGEVLFINLPLAELLSNSDSAATQEALANTLVGSTFSAAAVVGYHL